jgi:hypothetical protein
VERERTNRLWDLFSDNVKGCYSEESNVIFILIWLIFSENSVIWNQSLKFGDQLESKSGTILIVIRPFNYRNIHRKLFEENKIKLGLALDLNLKRIMIPHYYIFFKTTYFANHSISRENKIFIKPAFNTFTQNLECLLGYAISQKLSHFNKEFESEEHPTFSIQGCMSFTKIQEYKLKPKIIFYVNQR